MNDYYSMFSEYLTNQKANSANTRESYLRDTMFFLEYLSGIGTAPQDADETFAYNDLQEPGLCTVFL